jgi:hypothetical protein
MKKFLFFLPISAAIIFLTIFALNGGWENFAFSAALLASYTIPFLRGKRGARQPIQSGSVER